MKKFTLILARQISRNTKLPLLPALAIEIISGVQLLHLLLDATFTNDSITSSFSGFFRDLTSYFGAVEVFNPLKSENTLKGIWFFLLLYTLFHPLLLIALGCMQRTLRKLPTGPGWTALSLFYAFHSRLFFFPVEYFFMGLIKTSIDCEGSDQGNFYCESYVVAISAVACFVNFLIAWIIEVYFFDVNKTKNSYAVKSNEFQQTILLHKTLGLIIHFLFLGQSYQDTFLAVVHSAMILLSMYLLLVNLPFYESIMIRTAVIITGLIMATTIILVFRVFSVEIHDLEIPWVLLNVFCVKMSLILLNYMLKRILQGKFDTPNKAIHFIILMKEYNFGHFALELHKRKFPKGGIIMNGALVNQNIDPTEVKGKRSMKGFESEMYSKMLEKLTVILSKNPKHAPLALFMAQLYLKKLGNIIQAITILKAISAQRLSIPLENSVQEFQLILKTIYTKQYRNQEENLELLKYFRYRQIADEIKEDIQIEVQKHIDFWQELKKDSVDSKTAFDLAQDAYMLELKIENRFNQHIWDFSRTLANSLLMYKVYLDQIREFPNESRKMMKKFISIIHNPLSRHDLDVYSHEKGVFILSLQKDHVGNILDASGSAQSLFQTDKKYLVGQNLSAILSNIFAKSHMSFLNSNSKNLSHRIQHKERTYGRTEDGNYFELLAQFQLYPEVDKEVKVFVLFEKVTPPLPMMIVGADGTILECSQSLKKSQGFETLAVGATKMQNISMEYDIVHKAFNMLYNPKNDPDHARNRMMDSSNRNSSFSKATANSFDTGFTGKLTLTVSDKDQLDNERATTICDAFMHGTKMTFAGVNGMDEVEYDIQIEPHILNDRLYLTAILKGQDIVRPPHAMANHSTLEFTQTQMSQITMTQEHDASLFAEDFPNEDERGGMGQDKFAKMTSLNTEQPMNKIFFQLQSAQTQQTFITRNTTYGNDLSPKNPQNLQLMVPQDNNKGLFRSIEMFAKPNKQLSSSMEPVKTQAVQRDMSVTSYATSGMYAIKALKRVFSSESTFTVARNSLLFVLLLIVIMITLSVVFFVFSQSAILNHEGNILVVNGVSQRLGDAITVWQMAIRIYLSELGLGQDEMDEIKDTMNERNNFMLNTSNEINNQLATTLDENRILEVFKRDIDFWEPYAGTKVNNQPMNTFQATNVLYTAYDALVDYDPDTDQRDMIFAINNTANDYIMSSENMITTTRNLMETSVDNNILDLKLILVGESLALGVMCIFVIYIAYRIIHSYKRLFRALMKIEGYHVENRIRQLQRVKQVLSEDLESIKYGADDGDISFEKKFITKDQVMNSKKNKAKGRRTGFSIIDDKFSVQRLTRYIAKYLLGGLIFVVVPAVLFYAALTASISDFHALDELDDELGETSNTQYYIDYLMSVFYIEMMFRNDTSMLVRDEAPSIQLEYALDRMNNLHEEIMAVFFNDGGLLHDPIVNDLLQSSVCDKLPDQSERYVESCNIATNGGKLGLVSLQLNYIAISTQYINMYLANPTRDNADDIVEFYSDDIREILETMGEAYEFLNQHLLDSSTEMVNSFQSRQNIFFVAILFAIVVAFLIVYWFIIRQFRFLDMGRGKVLKMLPYNIITENKALDFYLNKDFSKKKYQVGRRN